MSSKVLIHKNMVWHFTSKCSKLPNLLSILIKPLKDKITLVLLYTGILKDNYFHTECQIAIKENNKDYCTSGIFSGTIPFWWGSPPNNNEKGKHVSFTIWVINHLLMEEFTGTFYIILLKHFVFCTTFTAFTCCVNQCRQNLAPTTWKVLYDCVPIYHLIWLNV